MAIENMGSGPGAFRRRLLLHLLRSTKIAASSLHSCAWIFKGRGLGASQKSLKLRLFKQDISGETVGKCCCLVFSAWHSGQLAWNNWAVPLRDLDKATTWSNSISRSFSLQNAHLWSCCCKSAFFSLDERCSRRAYNNSLNIRAVSEGTFSLR